MGASDAGAHLSLRGSVEAAGDMWLGVALDLVQTPSLVTVTEADGSYLEIPRVLVPVTDWNPPALRSMTASTPTYHGAVLQDFTPQFFVLWSASTGGDPLWWRRVNDTVLRAGDKVTLPPKTIRLSYAGFEHTQGD